VKTVDIYVDGQQPDPRMHFAQACPTGSCSKSLAYTFHTSEWGAGDHTVRVVVTDQLDQPFDQSWTVTTQDPGDYQAQQEPPADAQIYFRDFRTQASDTTIGDDGGLTSSTGSYGGPAPYPSPYYYVSPGATPTSARNRGCSAAQQHRRGFMFLAFGGMKIRSGGNYTKSPSSPAGDNGYKSFHDDLSIAEGFAKGYKECRTGSITTAISLTVNNDLQNTQALGQAWGSTVKSFNGYLRQHGYSNIVFGDGGNDIEGSYSSPGAVFTWLSGYRQSTKALMANSGSADGCPPVTNGTCAVRGDGGQVRNWTQDDYWRLSTGATGTADVAFPQVYCRMQAKQWQHVSLYGATHHNVPIYFLSPLTAGSVDSGCNNLNDSDAAWHYFFQQLNTARGSSRTHQDELKYLTFVSGNGP
jgi:hypothetical protein